MTRRVLWTDDDGETRFVYEINTMRALGWEVVWAHDAVGAVERLRTERFDALILDQMLPWQRGNPIQLWGGCVVLWWLRQQTWPPQLPSPIQVQSLPFWSQTPLAGNAEAPAILVSAFYNEEVERISRGASALDQDIEVLAKPVRIDDLEDFLQGIP